LKVLLVVSWVFILISFASGIIQLVRDSSHLGSWSSSYRAAMDTLLSHSEEEKAIKEASLVLDRQDIVSNMVPFWIQVVFLSAAFVIQVALASIFLFLN